MDDRQAIQRLKEHDMSGLETLMTRYQVTATRAAFLITHDESLAADVVQETFLRIYERVHHFDDSLPFPPYLMRSVINAALNAVRGRQQVRFFDDDPAELEELLDRAASVESQIEFAELQQDILNALSLLSPTQRAVIVQRYYLEMSEKEMAAALGAAPGSVKWMLNAARQRLRRLLGQEGGSHE